MTPVHQWTNDAGEVLIVKCINRDGTAHGGFRYPLEIGAAVEAPDWNPKPECGGGLHGWPWFVGLGDGKEPDYSSGAVWLVLGAQPQDVVAIGGKCKTARAVVRFIGDWAGAFAFIRDGLVKWTQSSASSATGYRSASSATGDQSASSATGYRSASSATGFQSASSATGDQSASSATGDRSASSATGYRSASSATGDRSASSATGFQSASSATGYQSASSATGDQSASSATGYQSASSATGDQSASSATGDRSASVCTGLESRARAGKYGCIALAFWNARAKRSEMRCAEIGRGDGKDGKLKADTWYRLSKSGKFVEDKVR